MHVIYENIHKRVFCSGRPPPPTATQLSPPIPAHAPRDAQATAPLPLLHDQDFVPDDREVTKSNYNPGSIQDPKNNLLTLSLESYLGMGAKINTIFVLCFLKNMFIVQVHCVLGSPTPPQ